MWSENKLSNLQLSKFIVNIIGRQKTNFPCFSNSQKVLWSAGMVNMNSHFSFVMKQDECSSNVNKYKHNFLKYLGTSCGVAGLLHGQNFIFSRKKLKFF